MTSHPDSAVAAARRVVGLYGDPHVTWSMVIAVGLGTPRDRVAVASRAAGLCSRYPHLGTRPDVVGFAASGEATVLADFADRSYVDHEPLLRVALSEDGRTLVVAAHHGVMDGLGLLGAAAVLADADLASSARGIGRDAQPRGFLRRSAARVVEAMLHPPVRLTAVRDASASGDGDLLVARTVSAVRPSSAALVATAADAVRRWNDDRGNRPGGRLVVSMGLSRRTGTPAAPPDRDTAYVRLAADQVRTSADAAARIAATAPEPEFPETEGGGIGPAAARLLGHRLGASVLVSNLGAVADPDVVDLRFWPVPSGPNGFALGLASTGSSTTLTVRLRRRWFSADAAEQIADLVADRFTEAAT